MAEAPRNSRMIITSRPPSARGNDAHARARDAAESQPRSARSRTRRTISPRVRARAPENRRTTAAAPRVHVPWSAHWAALRAALRARASLFRRGGIWLAHLVCTGIALLGLWHVVTLTGGHLLSAPGFAIKAIELQGTTHLSQADVERIAGIRVGDNVFKVGLDDVRARLLAEPWIAGAEVRRRLPGTYSIRITERKAIALLARSELYLVSEQGQAFKPLGPNDPADLPLITGLEGAVLARDPLDGAAVLKDIVSLLRDYAAVGLSRRDMLSEVHVEADETLSCYVGADATYVRLGKPPYRNKLRRLREVLSQLAGQSARASYVYLDNEHRPDRVTVRLR